MVAVTFNKLTRQYTFIRTKGPHIWLAAKPRVTENLWRRPFDRIFGTVWTVVLVIDNKPVTQHDQHNSKSATAGCTNFLGKWSSALRCQHLACRYHDEAYGLQYYLSIRFRDYAINVKFLYGYYRHCAGTLTLFLFYFYFLLATVCYPSSVNRIFISQLRFTKQCKSILWMKQRVDWTVYRQQRDALCRLIRHWFPSHASSSIPFNSHVQARRRAE